MNPGGTVDDMGTFRIDFEVASQVLVDARAVVPGALVGTGSEATWIPAPLLESLGIPRRKRARFRQASGQLLERWLGPAIVFAAGTYASDDVVFAEPGDLTLLGARSLEGLNLHVDPVQKRLIDAGPMPAAAA